jgi:hypothetical protein
MAYVLNTDLTDSYIQSLITRNGFSNIVSQSPYNEFGWMYAIEDLNGNVAGFTDLPSARDWLIQQYVIIQNS